MKRIRKLLAALLVAAFCLGAGMKRSGLLRRMALAGAPHGSLCLCECQTAGRGRLGRSWHSPEGQGLWVSVLVRPKLTPDQAPLVTFAAAMAMQTAVSIAYGLWILRGTGLWKGKGAAETKKQD